eukprot:gene2364-3094_t
MLLMEEAEARRRRHLLQEEDETTEMEALSSNASIEGDTGEVDEVDAAVLHAEMMAELEAIGKGMEEMAISVNLAQAMVEEHSEGPREAEDERRTRVQDAWAAGYGAEAENIQTFSGSLETALENADKILDSLEALNEDLTETANEAAADAQAMENAFVESQEDGGDAATSSPPPVQPASVAATPFSPHLPPISPPASPQCPPPPPLSSIPFPPPPETGCSGNASSELQLAPLEYHFSVPPPKDKSEDVLNSSITDSDGSTSGTEGQPAARRLLARSGANVATKSTGASGEDDSTDAAGADGGTRSVDGQTVDASEVTQVWRGVARRNQLLVGMLLSTWRRSSAMCTERFPQLAGRHSDGTCYAGNYETSPFGSDATFNTVTDLFEQEVFEKEEDYYNLTTEVSYNNKTDALTAHPFQPHLGDASDVFLNASLSAKRAIQILDFLDISAYLNQIREHLRLFSVVLAAFNRWLHTVFRVNSLSEGTERLVRSDQESIFVLLTLIVSYRSRNLHTYPGQDATARFTTEFLLYNAETRMYSYVYVTFTRELGGGFQSDIKITLLENYLLKSFHLGDAVVVLLSVLLVYLSIQLFYRDIAQLQCLHRNTVSLTKICIEFFTSWTFASSLLLMSFLVCLYSTLYAILNIVYENEHAVYKDEYALSNYFDIETDDGITEVRRFMGTVAHVARLKSLFLGLSLLASLGNLCRLLDAAECHARLNVVSCTIRVVSSQLTHFLCVMFWITAAFAMLAHLTLGPTCTAYADLATAAVTMGDNLMGGSFGRPTDVNGVINGNLQTGSFAYVGFVLLYWAMNFIVMMCVLNFFFTIIGDGIGGTDEDREKAAAAESVFEGIWNLVYADLRRQALYPIRKRHVMQLLEMTKEEGNTLDEEGEPDGESESSEDGEIVEAQGVKLDLDKLKDVLNKRPLQMNENCRKEAETSAAFSSNTLRSDTLWESPTNLELVCCPKDEVEAMLSEIADLLRHPLSDVDKVTEDEDFLKSKSSERHLQRKSVAEFLVQA